MKVPATHHRIPLGIKLAFTVFVALLIVVYWRFWGPINFLWFCDIAIFLLLIGLWLESPLLIGMPAISVLLADFLWMASFVFHLFTGRNLLMDVDYMFDPKEPLSARCISCFHIWVPLFLLWLLWRVGYDRRAWPAQSALALVLLIISYFVVAPQTNINYVWGMARNQPQTWMPRPLWLLTVIALALGVVYPLTHLVLQRLFARPAPSAPVEASKI